MCEGSRKTDDLHMIFRLTKEIILLNNVKIFDKIFSDEFILDIIGALEYDPEVPNAQGHRAFVRKHVIFKEAVPIENASVASKIHQTYRIGYIKDIILLRALDDATMKNLNAIIDENNVLVASLLMDDASFFQDLFVRMRSSNISAESKSKLALFLLEFCILSKSLESNQRLQLYRDLINEGVVDIISDMLQSQDKVLASAGTNILMHFLHQDPNLVIKFIAHHEENYQEGNSLLGILVQGIVTDSYEGMHYQSCLRTLLGSSNPDVATDCKEVQEVIQFFVDKHLHNLIDVISSCCTPKGIARSTSAKPETLLYICEILSFCVLHHPNRIKLNIFASNTMEKILTLTHRKEKVLVVAAVQFMRTIIGRKDEFFINHIIKLNLLKPIIEVLVENGDRDNMLRSVVLGLFEYIRKEKLVSLIKYVAESFWDQLVKFEQLGSIHAFRPKHQEVALSSPSTSTERSEGSGDSQNQQHAT